MAYKCLERSSSICFNLTLPFITPVLLSRGTCESREALDERRRRLHLQGTHLVSPSYLVVLVTFRAVGATVPPLTFGRFFDRWLAGQRCV
jgi:hypothetical protein